MTARLLLFLLLAVPAVALQTEVLLSTDDLAARYQVSRATVHQWIYKGTAPRSLKIGKHRRFHMDDVLAWEDAQADQHREPAA